MYLWIFKLGVIYLFIRRKYIYNEGKLVSLVTLNY